jgi:hypothetical protein
MTMPGVCSRMTQGSRADGIFSSMSLLKFVPIVVDFVSTMGLSPLTVTVSCTVETSSLALNPAWIVTSLLTSREKPVISNRTV